MREVLVALGVCLALPACSAIIGIEDIPPPGDFPLSGTCEEQRSMPLSTVCAAELAIPGCSPQLLCDDSGPQCICSGFEGGLPDGFSFADVVQSFDGISPLDSCSGRDCKKDTGPCMGIDCPPDSTNPDTLAPGDSSAPDVVTTGDGAVGSDPF